MLIGMIAMHAAIHTDVSCPALQRLEKSGKGVALLKASRLQSDLEFLEKENNVLYSDLKGKDQEILQIKAGCPS